MDSEESIITPEDFEQEEVPWPTNLPIEAKAWTLKTETLPTLF